MQHEVGTESEQSLLLFPTPSGPRKAEKNRCGLFVFSLVFVVVTACDLRSCAVTASSVFIITVIVFLRGFSARGYEVPSTSAQRSTHSHACHRAMSNISETAATSDSPIVTLGVKPDSATNNNNHSYTKYNSSNNSREGAAGSNPKDKTERVSNITSSASMSSSGIKEPKTPSLSKSATFTSPSVAVLPETPERVPRHIQDLEDTPLLSPPHASSNTHLLLTPQKRKGSMSNGNNGNNTDFYSLLKSPAVRTEDKKLKRRSMELFGITSGSKSPEQLPREWDNEHLLKSPRRDYKEIRKISENLRTRLNYANVKVQHGWSNKSIGELEHSLEEIATNPQRSAQLNSKNLEDFWNLRADNLPNKTDINNENSNPSLLASPGQFAQSPHRRRRSSFVANIRLDEVAKRGSKGSPEMSSNSEFLPASMSNASSLATVHSNPPTSLSGLQTSPLRKDESSYASNKTKDEGKTKLSVSTKPSDTLEQDAIMSLISLSSPVKYSASGSSLSPSPPRYSGSPTRPGHGRLMSLTGITNKRLPPLPATMQPPLSAPGIMSSASDSSILAFDRTKDNRYILPSPPKFENRVLGMVNVNMNMNMNMSVKRSQNVNSGPNTNRNSISNNDKRDETDDETTEDEIIEDDEVVITDRVLPTILSEKDIAGENHRSRSNSSGNGGGANNGVIGGSGNKSNSIFRATKFDGMKMTSKKSK